MEKELAIYNELCAAAERVFNEGIQAPVGSYNLKDLSNIGKKNAPEGVFFRSDYDEENIINICVDTFECSFPAKGVFALAYRFEILAKVNKKDCAIYTHKADRTEPVAVFTFDDTTYDSLISCDSEKDFRPEMSCVFVDFASGFSVCCDGHTMNVTHIQNARITNKEVLNIGGILIPRDFAKTVKGCEVSIYKADRELIAVASNGRSCILVHGNYPKYKAVLERIDKIPTEPVHFAKNVRVFKKTVAAIAKASDCNVVYISGLNGDGYITISAMCDGGEISRRVDLESCLTFNFATALKKSSIQKINNAADTIHISYNDTIIFSGAKVVGMLQPDYHSDNSTPTIATAKKIATEISSVHNVYSNFVSFGAPADSIQAADSIDSADTLNISPVAHTDSIQAEEDSTNVDTLTVTPVAHTDSIQAEEDSANVDTLNITPVAHTDSIQAAEDSTNVDTLNVTPVAPADSIQAAEESTNVDTLNVTPVAPADSIQAAEESTNVDTLNITPVAPADGIHDPEGNATTNKVNIDKLRCLMFIFLQVAAICLFVFLIRMSLTSGINASAVDITPVVHVDSIHAVKDSTSVDALNVTPVVHADSIHAAKDSANVDTLNVTPVVHVDSIHTVKDSATVDTLNITPVVHADSIQAAKDSATVDTLNITPVVHADSIQAVKDSTTVDTLNVNPLYILTAYGMQKTAQASTHSMLHPLYMLTASMLQKTAQTSTRSMLHPFYMLTAYRLQKTAQPSTRSMLHPFHIGKISIL